MDFDTSEKVTKFLRSKGGKPADLLLVAKALSSGDLQIYLPQKEPVILEWWFYFVGDKKNFAVRCDPEFWGLLSDVWSSLQEDQETLSRIYLSNNFLAILTNTLDEIIKLKESGGQVRRLIMAIGRAIKTLGTSGLWFRVPSDTANNILFGLLKVIEFLKVNHEEILDDVCTSDFVQEISNVLQATLYGTSDLKGMCTIFNSKCLPAAFLALGYSLPESIHNIIKSITSVLLYEKENAADTDFNTISPENAALKNASNETLTQAALHIYSIICEKAPKKAPGAFFSLTQIYPESTKQLIRISGEHQIKISTESLAALVDKALENQELDWEFLESALELDSAVITEEDRATKILSKNSLISDGFISFSQAFIKYFAEARELTTFILSWKKHIKNSYAWCSDAVLNCLAVHIKSLSTHQMKGLLNQLVKSISDKGSESASQIYTPIIAVVMSFFLQLSPPAAVLHESLFAILDSTSHATSELFWRTKYLILCLNGSIVRHSSKGILKHARQIKYGLEEKKSDELCLYVMQVVFRIREFTEVEKFDSIVKKILKYIGKTATNPEAFLEVINQRWLLVANSAFDQENRERLVGLFALYENSFNKLCENEVFYEQKNISKIVVSQIAASESDFGLLRLKVLSTMPMEIVWRENRVKILNILTSFPFDDASDIERQVYIRTAINKFLEHPTVSTDFETKPNLLRDYFTSLGKSENEPLEASTRNACESIISYHSTNRLSQDTCANYLKNLIEHEKSFLEKLKASKSLSTSKRRKLDFSCLVATTAPIELITESGLGELLIKVLLSQLEIAKSDISDSLSQSLLILRNLNSISSINDKLITSPNLHAILGGYAVHAIQNLMNNKSDIHSRQILIHTFQVLVRTSVSTIEVETVVALYAILSENDVQVEELELLNKLSELEEPQFVSFLAATVSDCFEGTLSPSAYFKVVKLFASAASHKNHAHSVEHFIRLISLTLVHSKSLDAKSLLSFLDLVDLLLKDRTWIITQYALELIISTVTEISLEGPEVEVGGNQDDVFAALTHVLSSILLFHRHRLNGRYYLLTKVFSALLTALAIPRHALASTRFSRIPKSLSVACEHQLSEKSAVAYSRLLENLCSPPIQAIRERSGKANLTSAANVAKHQVSKFIGILLINYVRLTLQTGFSGSIKKALTPGFYLVFDVLGEDRLRNTNFLLDANSRPYFKTLYEDYMAHGKWKNN